MISQIVDEEEIVIGDKVDLVAQSGLVYRAMVEDQREDGSFLVGIPSKRGVHMHVEQDDDIYLVFYRPSGRYIAQMKAVSLENHETVRYMWLLQKTKVQRNQRREAFRLPIDFEVQIFEYFEEIEQELAYPTFQHDGAVLETVNCIDLSVTGIALKTRRKYAVDENYLLSLYFERTPVSIRNRSIRDAGQPLYLMASVKRSAQWHMGNMFNTGMQFFGMTERMQDGLSRFLLIEQQRQIKKRRRLI